MTAPGSRRSDPDPARRSTEPPPRSAGKIHRPTDPTTGQPRAATRLETLRLNLALLFVWTVGRIVPHRLRAGWTAEWRAELLHRYRLQTRSPERARDPGLISRSLSSIPHALTLARLEWNPDMLRHDLWYAVRKLTKNPGFAIVAVSTLAVGIGANTAIFSILHSTIVRPWPYPDADRMVVLWKEVPGQQIIITPRGGDVARWRQHVDSLEAIHTYASETFTLTGGDEPREILGLRVSPSFLDLLGAEPRLGRGLRPEEARADARVAVISDGLWRSHFGADPEVLGKDLRLNGEAWIVVGVLPAGLRFPDPFHDIRVVVPLPDGTTGDDSAVFALGLLRPGSGVEATNQELAALAAGLGEEASGLHAWPGKARRPQDLINDDFRTAVLVLQAAVALVLLVAAANLANLLLARAGDQARETAIRAALGAGRLRLVRQLLVENLVLAVAGGAAGLGLASLGLEAMQVLRPENLDSLHGVRLDGVVLLFALGVTGLTALLSGLPPALRASRPAVLGGLRATRSMGSGRRRRGLARGGLVSAEVALSLVLLVGAGLLLNSLDRLLRADPGFDPENLLTLSVRLPPSRYPEASHRDEFRRQLEERLRAAGGERLAALATASGTIGRAGVLFGSFTAEGEEARPAFDDITVSSIWVSAGYFRTLGVTLLHGREFGDAEAADRPVIVNAEWSRRMWDRTDVVGERFASGGRTPYTVVGVVDDVHTGGPLSTRDDLQLYFPLDNSGLSGSTVLARTTSDPLELVPLFKEQVWALDPELPIQNVAPVDHLLAETLSDERFAAALMGLFAAIALGLAVIGVYGVLAYSVGRRRREIGIRMALGADRRDVVPMVLREGMRPVLVGLAIGIGGALGLARFLESLLYEVAPTDPATYVVVSLLLGGVAAVACWIPARRAAGVDPLVALRAD